jgi:hypothetical protein
MDIHNPQSLDKGFYKELLFFYRSLFKHFLSNPPKNHLLIHLHLSHSLHVLRNPKKWKSKFREFTQPRSSLRKTFKEGQGNCPEGGVHDMTSLKDQTLQTKSPINPS